MAIPTVRLAIPKPNGGELAAIIDEPASASQGLIVFAHCFTCSKDLKTIVRLSRSLRDHGWTTVRFDFTGIGQSSGKFADTNFDTNVDDLKTVCRYLVETNRTVDFLFGHSFGGAAATVAAPELNVTGQYNIRGIITLAAPSDTAHLAEILMRMNPSIETDGLGDVAIGGKSFTISRGMIENFRNVDFPNRVREARRSAPTPQLVLQSIKDETVRFSHGQKLFELLSRREDNMWTDVSYHVLPQADHLLARDPADVQSVLEIVDIWCRLRAT